MIASQSQPLNVAIVGCGWAAGWHVTDLKLLPELFTLVAGCDPDEQRLRGFCDAHGIPFRTPDFAVICALPDVDVIVICTPPSLHHAMVLAALAAGKHVVCEKPFASSLAHVDAIKAAEARSPGRVMPVFQYRFGAGVAKARHLLASGVAGKHYVSSVETARWRGPEYYQTEWRGKFATELGGVLLTQAIHIHDLLYCLLGPVSAVTSFKTTRVNPIEVEDCAVACLQLADGSLASLTATLGSVRQVTRLRLCFEHLTIEVEHGDGRPGDEPWTILPRTEKIAQKIAEVLKDFAPGKSWFAGQYELFFQALATNGAMPVTLDDARASIELITALFASHETGAVVQLPLGPGHPKYHGWVPRDEPPVCRSSGTKYA